MDSAKPYASAICLAIIFLLAAAPAKAVIIHVPTDAPSIKAAIVEAQESDTVMVSPGVYTGNNNTDIDMSRKAITVMSLKGSAATVIDCQGTRQNPHRGFYVRQGEDGRTIIKGFTVINGFAPFDQGGKSLGGGILCIRNSSPTVLDCVFQDNTAVHAGGGMYSGGGASPHVYGCVFDGNTAIDDLNGGGAGYGGGVRCDSSSAIFIDCIFSSNRANYGGGMSCTSSSNTLLRCTLRNNVADVVLSFEPAFPGMGGGAYLNQTIASFTECTFDGNLAVQGMNTGMQNSSGGGLYSYQSLATLQRCTLYGNTAESYGEQIPGLGAGIFFSSSPIMIYSCLIAFGMGGEAIYRDSADSLLSITILCSDIYGNELGDWTGPFAELLGLDGNFSDDPLFCDTAGGNLRLREESPCAPGNNSCEEIIGAFDAGCETGVDDEAAFVPGTAIDLNQNYPNPFNRGTAIGYALPRQSRVQITVYNVAGQSVRRLADGMQTAGFHRVFWDGQDDLGREVASGIYLYRLQADAVVMSRKMILLK